MNIVPITHQTLARADIVRLCGERPVRLVDCDLEEVNLAGVDLSGWMFERCSLRHTDLTGATLVGTTWQSCRAAFANFSGADLAEAVIGASDFNNVSLRRANIASARFTATRMTGADFHGVKGMGFAFEEVLLVGARLAGLSFRKETLRRVDLAQADLAKCDFRATVFEGCSLREANMDGARFAGADLRGADLGGVKLEDAALFRGAVISREQAEQLLSGWGLLIR
ncbi:MAG: hypothetical protein C0409_09330 [Novosphingobium sp.]|nr:hypothetical protein [Novosphingobium sp.]